MENDKHSQSTFVPYQVNRAVAAVKLLRFVGLMQLPRTPPDLVSIDEFLPILMASEVRLELIDGRIVPFANGTLAHSLVCERVISALSGAVKTGCEIFSSQVGLQRVDASTYVFPDASCTCEPLDPELRTIVAPDLVVEVMSPQSVERDRVDKLDTYQAIGSIQEYLIVDSRRIWACVYRRSENTWIHTNYGPDDTIELASLGNSQINIADLYPGPAPIV